jgi:hypothetical protein
LYLNLFSFLFIITASTFSPLKLSNRPSSIPVAFVYQETFGTGALFPTTTRYVFISSIEPILKEKRDPPIVQ